MSDQNKCREIAELLPLYYNSGLEEGQMDSLRLHLEACPDCRKAYSKERVLFAIAGGEQATALERHADADLLDIYTRDRDSIETDQRSELEAHLAECQLCREAVEKLAALPADLSELIPSGQLPLISDLNRRSQETPSRSNITDITRRVWRPFTAIAAAAVIIIVGLSMMTYDGPEQTARVEGTFPASTRAVPVPTVFETEFEIFTFAGRVYVDPEENHDYSLLIRDVVLDSIIFTVAQLVTFDSLGFATCELVMSPGTYELILYDILEADSLEIVRSFEIRMKL